jgi:FecR protein
MKDTPLHPLDPEAQPADEEEIAQLLRSIAPAHRVPDHELPPIKAAARAAWLRQVRRTARWRRAAYAGVALAAAVALAAGISLLRPASLVPHPAAIAATLEAVVGEATIGEGRAAEAPGHEVASGTRITTSDSGRTAFRLAAGHSVRVDVRSSVRIVSGRALSLERGAVYVDTEAARVSGGAPIEIDTPFGRVTDVGTQFEVRLAASEGWDEPGVGRRSGALRVTVREGTVRLATELGAYEVAAGSELHLRPGGQLDRLPAPPYGESWHWMESVRPPLRIEGVGLTDFLDWASRESGRRWRFVEPGRRDEVRDVLLHGSIDGMTVEEALSTVLPSCGLRHRIAGEELLIESDES